METPQRSRRKLKLETAPCHLCSSEFTDTRRGRRYCSKACRKTAEIRRYRFKKHYGVQIEDVVPKDGNWFSELDARVTDALRAHKPSQERRQTPCAVTRKRKGRPPLAEVVRSNGKINHMALRDQVFNIVVRGPRLIERYRNTVRERKATLKIDQTAVAKNRT